MLGASDLGGRQVQHRFHRRPPRDVNQLIDRQGRILDKLDQGKQQLPFFFEKFAQRQLVMPIGNLILCHSGGSLNGV